MAEEDNENIPEAEYSPKSDFSKAEVVKAQVMRCNEIRSKEMREGYFNYDNKGNKVFIPDARREWVSAVKALNILLSPEAFRNKRFQKAKEQLAKKEKQSFDTWAISPEISNGNKIVVQTNTEKFIPSLDYKVPIYFVKLNNGYGETHREITYVSGKYNQNFHNYWDDLVIIYDELYAELNILIDSCNYFKQEVSY